MSTLKFSSLAKKVRLTKENVIYNPEQEVVNLRAEIKFLKDILHMKQSASGGISQILYAMKKLKEENESLKRSENSESSFNLVSRDNSLLRDKVINNQYMKNAGLTTSGFKLPYISLKNKRESFLQKTSSTSNFSSAKNQGYLEFKDIKLNRNQKDISPTRTRVSFKRSFEDLKSLNSPTFEPNKKRSKTEISVLDDTMGLSDSKLSNCKFFLIDSSPDKKSKFSFLRKEVLPQLKIDRSFGEKSFKNLIKVNRSGFSNSENPTTSKLNFSKYMQDQQANHIVNKTSLVSSKFQKRNSVSRNAPIRKMSASDSESHSNLTKFEAIKSKLDQIQTRLIRINLADEPMNLPGSKPKPPDLRNPMRSNAYLQTLEGMKNEMQRFNFS